MSVEIPYFLRVFFSKHPRKTSVIGKNIQKYSNKKTGKFYCRRNCQHTSNIFVDLTMETLVNKALGYLTDTY